MTDPLDHPFVPRQEVKKMAPREMNWTFESGDYETMLEILRAYNHQKMNSDPFHPSLMKKPQSLTLSFEEALDIFTGKMKATERMQVSLPLTSSSPPLYLSSDLLTSASHERG